MTVVALIAILVAASAILLVSWSSTSAQKNSPQRLVEPVFNRVFGALSPPPKLRVSWSYAYPAFDVTFRSRDQMKEAEVLVGDFKRELNVLFKGYGAYLSPFDAEMAVSTTYPGQIEELMAKYGRKEPNQSPEPTRSARGSS